MSELATIRTSRHYEPAFGWACSRLRALQPEHPRVYAPAAMAEQGKRRWWRLADGLHEGRIELIYRRHAAEMISADAAAEVVATALIHAVVGRVVALLVAEGRVWDPGLENLWIHTDNDGGIDWAGLVDTTIRVVEGDRLAGGAGVVVLPCEEAMYLWLAHRCEPVLTLTQGALTRCAGLSARRFWALVGESISGASTYVPDLARTDPVAGMRRGQGLMLTLEERGLPVRRSIFPMSGCPVR
ncbi:hypothetical protein [Nocardia donostiensis]|uniref:Iron reductase n=1 Tax=Nocardia donostiensis TaxID=1538463 RepID=A0A1V2TJJ7_9NOCA|nr:hypothetical protein [Nocardia donostiensis]ONM49700.1 hypothetical protein B0T46_04555 [Nocardia donostiensis]OQS15418.1 hypothetical protein B0T36_09020 [Nocardia donostiensis]OQS16995.1 hypothetical protein B0T44_25050 [Nocardia donostiensis]